MRKTKLQKIGNVKLTPKYSKSKKYFDNFSQNQLAALLKVEVTSCGLHLMYYIVAKNNKAMLTE